MPQIGLVTEVVEVVAETWIASSGTKLSCVNEFPGEETKYLTGYSDYKIVFKFEDVVKGNSETAVLVFRAKFTGVVGGGFSVHMNETADSNATEVIDPVSSNATQSQFDGEWCIVYKIIHPDVWAEFNPLESGFAVYKLDDGAACDIAWVRLIVPEMPSETVVLDPVMLMGGRAAVVLDSALRQAEINCACGCGSGLRYGLGAYDGSSIRIAPNDTPASPYSWTNLDDTTDRLIAAEDLLGVERPGKSLLIIGTDTPNWAAYQTAVGGTWGPEASRPPPESWPQWAADAQASVDHIIAEYEAAGLDKYEHCIFQISNEVGKGGAGGPWTTAGPFTYTAPYDTLSDGEHDHPGNVMDRRNVADQLAYLVSNVDFRGCRVIGNAHETAEDPSFQDETDSMFALAAHWPAVNRPALNHYINAKTYDAVHKRRFVAKYYDSIMTARARLIAAVEAAMPGLGWDSLPWALTEFGGTLTKCGMGGVNLPQFGHSKRGEYLVALAERLMSCGYFEIISFHVTREFAVAADADLFGLMKSDGTYSMAYRWFANRGGVVAATPPSGSYATVSGETAGTAGVG